MVNDQEDRPSTKALRSAAERFGPLSRVGSIVVCSALAIVFIVCLIFRDSMGLDWMGIGGVGAGVVASVAIAVRAWRRPPQS